MKTTEKLIQGIDVFIQDQTSPLFQYFLLKELKTDITLTSAVEADDITINVSAGHGFTGAAGEFIVLRQGDVFEQSRVLSVSTNELTIGIPTANVFTVDDCIVIRGSNLLNLDGSVTQEDSYFRFYDETALTPVDISKVIITIQHGTVADDSLFGNLTALTTPVYFRKINGEKINLGSYFSNQDFKDLGAKVNYTDKAGGGAFATDITFDIKETFGQVIRLSPKVNDLVCFSNPSNISALNKFTVSLIGSYTSGE